ncbi:MAG TPA: YgiQ family radical SAM protein [Spirochaetota bacterium]|nr:YgiQ family radical SAM protein [Spirochaetota bacterium]
MERQNYDLTKWLPTSVKEAKLKGWDDLDVILFSGDAYVDHPSFGSALIGRLLESHGLKVAIVPQPNWRDDLRDFKKFGKPSLFFAVTSGCMDSMVNHYTAAKRLRSDDAYSPDGQSGKRPDYAVTVYSSILKKLFPDTPVIIGGIEASLRRLTHYDYWSDSLKPSILIESGADLLIYGMGEKPLSEIVTLLKKGVPFQSLKTTEQCSYLIDDLSQLKKRKNWEDIFLYSHEECLKDKNLFAKNFLILEESLSCGKNIRLIQQHKETYVVINPMFTQTSTKDIDSAFDLPFTRLPHPRYKGKRIPAYEMIRHSVTSHRGCFGGCSFCAITAHQGKNVISRSPNSIVKEVKRITEMEDFSGYISDIGGPSANMYMMGGIEKDICKKCKRPSCLFPSICNNLNFDHQPLIDLYNYCSKINGVKKIFISSGIRYDMLLCDDKEKRKKFHCDEYTEKLITEHVSGRLKVAPEHTSQKVLNIMRKPSYSLFVKFKKIFNRISDDRGLRQQIIPYFISSHPGSEIEDMIDLAIKTSQDNLILEQVQDFTPTPMTLSSVIYYTGFSPYSGERIYCARSKSEREEQKVFLFWYKDENRQRIYQILKNKNKTELLKKLYPGKISKPQK